MRANHGDSIQRGPVARRDAGRRAEMLTERSESESSVATSAAAPAEHRGPPPAMVNAFRTESPQLVLRIQSGAVEGRFQHVRHCARYLRTVALEVGAESLAEVCGEIE